MEFFGKDVDDISANDDHTARLDLSPLAKGLYIATVVTADGTNSIKLIKITLLHTPSQTACPLS